MVSISECGETEFVSACFEFFLSVGDADDEFSRVETLVGVESLYFAALEDTEFSPFPQS